MILGSIFNGIMARIANNRAEESQAKALRVLNDEEEELKNLFKSSYYSDYMNRADVQNLITSAKEAFLSNSYLKRYLSSLHLAMPHLHITTRVHCYSFFDLLLPTRR